MARQERVRNLVQGLSSSQAFLALAQLLHAPAILIFLPTVVLWSMSRLQDGSRGRDLPAYVLSISASRSVL
jgi:hypothetical protein